MREKIRRSMAFLLTAVLLIGMVPDTVYANSTEMTAQKVTTGAVSTPEEQENTGEGTTTEAEKAAERTTTEKEAASEKITTEKESTTEDTAQPEKEITTEKETATESNSSTEENSSEDKNGSEKGTATEENDMVTTENASTETAPETEAASEETANQVTRKILKKTDPQSAAKSYMIYSDGSWSEGTIWYVNSGGKKHYVFCLDHGATMYTGKYTGTVTSGYSGEQAFRFSTALNFFKEMNGGYSKKSYYGTVQQVIWNQTDKNGLKTYVSNAWRQLA